MKKNLCFLLTFVISLFIFSGRVDAAKELTCIYKGGVQDGSKMLVQNLNGEQFAFINNDNKIDINDPNWYDPMNGEGNDRTIIFHSSVASTKYDENGYLLSCPSYAQKVDSVWNKKGYTYKFSFSDSQTGFLGLALDYDLVDEFNKLPDLDVYLSFTSDKIEEYNEIIENTEWSAKCTYYATGNEKIHLYFNEDKYILINESESVYSNTAKFTLKELWEVANSINGCPPKLYEKNAMPTASLTENFYMDYYLNNKSSSKEYISIDPDVNFIPSDITEPDLTIDDCKDLFGDDLVKRINDFMDIVKILVPILLIAYGIVDFTKAVFSSSVDDMSKHRKKFLRRIVAAVLVFLAPIFINLVLTLANNVWDDISPDACIEQDN